jgi:hypothetical protein
MQRKLAVVLAASALGIAAFAPAANGASTKTCTESGTPHKNFTTTNTQTSACNSASDNKSSPLTATNAGGNNPPGQQP